MDTLHELLNLEDLLAGEASCQSRSHRHGFPCTVTVRWRSTSNCDGDVVLWCDGRYRQYVDQNLRDKDLCAYCHRPIASCWLVLPA